MCGGFWSGSCAFSGCNFFVVLHSFVSFASLTNCRSPAQDIGGMSVAGVAVSLSYFVHWPYLGSYVMIVVEERHDFGCRCVYLVGSCSVTN